jgi:hypothetical protein
LSTNYRPMSAPSDTTGVLAGVLALMGGLFLAAWSLGWLDALFNSLDSFGFRFTIAEAMLAAVLLLPGGILLLRRRRVGRWLTVIGCGVNIAEFVLAVSMRGSGPDYLYPIPIYLFYTGDSGSAFIYVLFPVVALVLALLPSTRRWCRPFVSTRS